MCEPAYNENKLELRFVFLQKLDTVKEAHLSYSSYVCWRSVCATRVKRYYSVQRSFFCGDVIAITSWAPDVVNLVCPIKKGLWKVTEGTLNTRLSKVLFTYQVTPHATTGVSPAELLLHYPPRTRLDLLFPQIADRIENQQSRQKKLHGRTAQQRDFTQGQAVYARNFREGERWIPEHIVEVMGPVSYNVELEDGRRWKRHQDHIKSRLVVSNDSSDIPIPDTTLSGAPSESFPVLPESAMNSTSSPVEPESQLQPSVSEQSRRYPVRER